MYYRIYICIIWIERLSFREKSRRFFASRRLSSVSRRTPIANGNSKMRRKSGSGACSAKFSRRTWACRACVRVRRYARENTTWAFLGVERGREEGLPDRGTIIWSWLETTSKIDIFLKVVVGTVARVATYECFVRDDSFAYDYHPFK